MKISIYDVRIGEKEIPFLAEVGKTAIDGRRKYNCPDLIAELATKAFAANQLTEEHVWMLCINAACRPNAAFEVSHGATDFSIATPSMVFQRLLLAGAYQFVLIHNHPSGATDPSEEDLKLTEKLKAIGQTLDIPLVDHVIIGAGQKENYFSFRENNML